MTDPRLVASEKKIRLAVVVADFGDAAHVLGAHVQTTVRTFELAPEVVAYIAKSQGKWTTVSLALEVSGD